MSVAATPKITSQVVQVLSYGSVTTGTKTGITVTSFLLLAAPYHWSMARLETFGRTLLLVYGTTKDFGRTLSLVYLHLTRINVVVVGGLEAAIN